RASGPKGRCCKRRCKRCNYFPNSVFIYQSLGPTSQGEQLLWWYVLREQRAPSGALFRSADDLDDNRALARTVVEIEQHNLLPGPELEPSPRNRDRLRWTDDRGPLVRVRVGVVVEPIVLVVPLRRNQAIKHRSEVAHPTGLVLHRRDRCGRAADERRCLPVLDACLL